MCIKSKHILTKIMIAFVSIIGQEKNLSQNPHPSFKNFKEEPINCNQKKKKKRKREKKRVTINGNRNTWKRITFV